MALIIPNVIVNGDVEDADVVMENFDYIAAHAPSGAGTTIINNLATWGDVTGTGLLDAGVAVTQVIRGGGTTVVDNVATWNDTTGSALTDSGIAISSLVAGAATVSTPANPTATTSMVGVMMGLAGTVTPTRSGKVMVTITMQVLPGGDTATVQMRYGTGSAPVNGAALTGTTASPIALITTQSTPVTLVALITGLTIGVAVWLDVSLMSDSGGSVSVILGHIVALEA